MSKDDEVQVIRVPNMLKKKVGAGRGINPEALEAAERAVAEMKPEFETWSGEDLVEMQALFASACSDEAGRSEHLAELFRRAHNLKGDGGTFEYPLITRIAGSLSGFLEELERPDARDLEVIKAHLDALAVVIGQKISGDGGEMGKVLVEQLQAAVQAVEERRRPKSGG